MLWRRVLGHRHSGLTTVNSAVIPGVYRGFSAFVEEKVIIIDENGEVESTFEFVREYPDWYEFIDVTEINGIYYHYYQIRAP